MFRVYVSKAAEVKNGHDTYTKLFMELALLLILSSKYAANSISFKYSWDGWSGYHQSNFVSGFVVTFSGTHERQLSGNHLCLTFNYIPPLSTF
jgi:hypothetical protein